MGLGALRFGAAIDDTQIHAILSAGERLVSWNLVTLEKGNCAVTGFIKCSDEASFGIRWKYEVACRGGGG